jgi:16S rRNA (uracil1498-N3)-methyltransferase
MQLFFIPHLSIDFTIEGEEAGHISRVLRKKVGDFFEVTDGTGKGYKAEIVEMGKNDISARILEEIKVDFEIKTRVHLAVAPTKNIDRFEWMIEKAVELGVSEITPILCDRSERKIVNIERMNKLALAAMKQSGRFLLPKVNELVKMEKFKTDSELKLIAHCEDIEEKNELNQLPITKSVTILIGPEGDFSPKEIEKAKMENYQPISLGKSRLRTETAAIYAMSFFRFTG